MIDLNELFLEALGVEEQTGIDYLSVLYMRSFALPIYASVQLCSPCRVKLHVAIDRLDDKEDFDEFEHYWKTEKYLSPEFSDKILKDSHRLRAAHFTDHCDFNSRDGFEAYCKGIFKGKPFRFSTYNPRLKGEKTHCTYLMIIRKTLLKLFPNIKAIGTMRDDF